MALIRRGHGSELYIYESGNDDHSIYVCCGCPRDYCNRNFDTKKDLKAHILDHKQLGHTIGLVGSTLGPQSYDELLEAVDNDDF
jgi:uncharacterized UBP type Zn finger protein